MVGAKGVDGDEEDIARLFHRRLGTAEGRSDDERQADTAKGAGFQVESWLVPFFPIYRFLMNVDSISTLPVMTILTVDLKLQMDSLRFRYALRLLEAAISYRCYICQAVF